MKRLVDVLLSILGLLVLSPLFLVIAVAICVDTPGSVLFRGERIGKNGVPFRIFKFRTMISNAANIGPGITPCDDVRVTRVGKFLRQTKFDELPQLINVLIGDMSLVGPRPEDPRYVRFYTQAQQSVLSVKPGMTSPASLQFYEESSLLKGEDWERYYIEEILPKKLGVDIEYMNRATIWSDLWIIMRTIFSLLG